MSVLVKGMAMPMNCDECPFCDYEQGNCTANNERNTLPHDGMKKDWCPLVEVPKHGRLIDADELTELCDIMADKCDEIGGSIWRQFRATVEWTPTIIEAEE